MYGIDKKVQFRHKVNSANWSSDQQAWSLAVDADGTPKTFQCRFMLMCTGYYDYDQPLPTVIPGIDNFAGKVIHPQFWPEDHDYTGKNIVIIGSGATAITLVPALAEKASHVTMLQRSPSYIVTLPAEDPLAKLALRVLPPMAAYQAVRWKNVGLMILSYQLSRRRPRFMKSLIRRGVQRQLPPGYDVDTHFRPNYDPWDQRLCVVPDGDLFAAMRRGEASVVTDQIETCTERGLQLRGGRELEADVIVTATGLTLVALGGLSVAVDGHEVKLSDTVVYKGMMLSGVPNLALAIGYTNASWTLKADLTCKYVCRLLNHMRKHGYDECIPAGVDPGLIREPLLNLASGYVLRSVDELPSQGAKRPWRAHQNYAFDVLDLRLSAVEDGVMRFSRGGAPTAAAAPAAATPVTATPAAA